MHATGLMALDSGGPIDFERMRRERFQRALAAMERHKIDSLILSRPENVRYVSGALSTWRAGRGGFSPSAIVLRDRQELHFFTLWDYGVPESIPRDRLHPSSVDSIQVMDGLRQALGSLRKGRIGVDHLSPSYSRLLAEAFSEAGVVDGATAMFEARSVKTMEEIACIRNAMAIAEGALAEAISRLKPGISERALLGAFIKRAAGMGAVSHTLQAAFCVQPLVRQDGPDWMHAYPPLRQVCQELPVRYGDLVTMCSSVSYLAYEADVGRTWLCGDGAHPEDRQRALYRRWRDACAAMVEACRPGRVTGDLDRAFQRIAPRIMVPVAHGAGMGMEPPIIGGAGHAAVETALQPGMVLVVQPYVWEAGAGGFWAKETVLVTETGPEVLTRLPHGPFVNLKE